MSDEVSLEDVNPHHMRCWPPGECFKALGRGLGMRDELGMKLWEENFLKRLEEKEVGFNIRNCFACCVKLFLKDPNDVESEEIALEPVPSNIELIKTEALDSNIDSHKDRGLRYFEQLQKKPKRTVQSFRGKITPLNRANFVTEEIRRRENEINSAPANAREKLQRDLERDSIIKHHHHPFFFTIISILQLIILIVFLSINGFAHPGIEPQIELIRGVTTFRGIEDYDVWKRPNIWLGPNTSSLITWGAIYGPCMRTDSLVNAFLQSQPHVRDEEPGCCVMKLRDIAGTTTKSECYNVTVGGGTWTPEVCSKSSPGVKTILRPCCFGLLGNCKMTTEEGCAAHKGRYFKTEHEHCGSVFCFPFICGKLGLKADDDWRFMPSATNQGWRFLSSLFIHAGVLHYILVLIINWTVGRPIEGAAGHIRIALVYFSGAIGGNLVGGFFDPYLPHVGCSGAIFGLVGVAFLEALQALAYKPIRYICELLILCLVGLCLIICGFFAFVSNWAHFGGLIFTIPMALAIMPHLCFNRWNCSARKIIFLVSMIWLAVELLIFLVLFYTVQDAGFCPNCYYFSCIPWTKNVCNVFPELAGTLSHD